MTRALVVKMMVKRSSRRGMVRRVLRVWRGLVGPSTSPSHLA